MPLMVTPGQFSRRSEFYYQLGQLSGAGLGLIAALQQLQRHPPSRSYRKPIGKALDSVQQGFTFSESMQRAGHWLPEFDLALLHAGEQSGRLDSCFRLLADYYQERAQLARQLIGDLAYPVALFHFAIFILPFARFFTSGNWAAYLAQTVGVLIPIYAVMAVIIYATQSRHGETWRAWIESILSTVPILGKARHYLALARLAGALEALISSGVTIIEAWELAANASGSPALRRVVSSWRPHLRRGQTPSEAVLASGRFPEVFSSQYTSGEISGQLDESLRRLRRYYQDEGARKMQALAQWTPRVVYLFVALMIGYYVIQFWTNYFKQIGNAAGW
jgi:type II secretory pathway component PulF